MSAQTVAPPTERASFPAVERRAWVRFSCDVEAVYSSVTDGNPERWQATVHNISASGIGLRVNREFGPGALLSLELPVSDNEPSRRILARVVHATPLSVAEWLVG